MQPIGWNMNATTFNVGDVNQHSLLLGTAERADVVVDFAAFAGKTLILYNDAPAAFPAGVPTYDYFTASRTRWMWAARPPRCLATAPTPGRSCRYGWPSR